MKGTGVSMTLIDCKDVGSPTVRSPQAVVIIPVNVSWFFFFLFLALKR